MAWSGFKKNKRVKHFATSLKWAWKVLKEEIAAKEASKLLIENLKVLKETAKAICVEVVVACIHTDQYKNRNIWLPKSQIKGGVVSDWIRNIKENELLEDYQSYHGARSLVVEW